MFLHLFAVIDRYVNVKIMVQMWRQNSNKYVSWNSFLKAIILFERNLNINNEQTEPRETRELHDEKFGDLKPEL